MKITFIQPPYYNEDGTSRYPSIIPLAIPSMSTSLKKRGHKTEAIDIFLNNYSKSKVTEILSNTKTDLFAISALSSAYSYVIWLCDEIKRLHPDKKIIIGGSLATHNPKTVLNNSKADICVIGEGEKTIVELAENIPFQKIKGIAFKKKDRIIWNSKRKQIGCLDEIGFPDLKILDVERYINIPLTREDWGKRSINLYTSRGCPFNCSFCSISFPNVRLRSVKNIREDIKTVIKKYKPDILLFPDELFTQSKQRTRKLCEEIKKHNIKWFCQGRVNIVDEELLRIMKDAGCIKIIFGIESGSQEILDSMNKRTTVKKNLAAIKACHKAGLAVSPQLMFGFPEENEETIEETIEFCKEAKIGRLFFSILTLLPGSELYDKCLKKGIIKDEHEYLLSLNSTGKKLINLTIWSDKEFGQKLEYMRRKILINHYKYLIKNPKMFAKTFFLKAEFIMKYVRFHGFTESIKRIVYYLQKDPLVFFSPV